MPRRRCRQRTALRTSLWTIRSAAEAGCSGGACTRRQRLISLEETWGPAAAYAGGRRRRMTFLVRGFGLGVKRMHRVSWPSSGRLDTRSTASGRAPSAAPRPRAGVQAEGFRCRFTGAGPLGYCRRGPMHRVCGRPRDGLDIRSTASVWQRWCFGGLTSAGGASPCSGC